MAMRRGLYNLKERRKFLDLYGGIGPTILRALRRMVSTGRSRNKWLGIGLNQSIKLADLQPPPMRCPYLDVELVYMSSSKGQIHPHAASIDRIDPAKGYVPGNVQIISALANQMKSCATKEQLIQFAKGVLAMHLDRGV